MPYRVEFEFSGGVKAEGALRDIAELEKLAEESPFTSKVNLWGEEIYFDLPIELDLQGERTEMEIGEIAYWPEGNSLCIFFGKTPASKDDKPVAYSDVKPLGKITKGLEDLKKVRSREKVTVKLEKA